MAAVVAVVVRHAVEHDLDGEVASGDVLAEADVVKVFDQRNESLADGAEFGDGVVPCGGGRVLDRGPVAAGGKFVARLPFEREQRVFLPGRDVVKEFPNRVGVPERPGGGLGRGHAVQRFEDRRPVPRWPADRRPNGPRRRHVFAHNAPVIDQLLDIMPECFPFLVMWGGKPVPTLR